MVFYRTIFMKFKNKLKYILKNINLFELKEVLYTIC